MKNRSLFILAVVFLALGVILPFLMVVEIVESTFFLNFFAFGLSVSGMMLGFMTAAQLFAKRDDD